MVWLPRLVRPDERFELDVCRLQCPSADVGFDGCL